MNLNKLEYKQELQNLRKFAEPNNLHQQPPNNNPNENTTSHQQLNTIHSSINEGKTQEETNLIKENPSNQKKPQNVIQNTKNRPVNTTKGTNRCKVQINQ